MLAQLVAPNARVGLFILSCSYFRLLGSERLLELKPQFDHYVEFCYPRLISSVSMMVKKKFVYLVLIFLISKKHSKNSDRWQPALN